MDGLTEILNKAEQGNPVATNEILPIVYAELRRLAHSRLSNDPAGQSLQTTDLIHEAYLRLVGKDAWDGKHHFFAAASEAMRRILIDRARRKRALKHGAEFQRVAFDEQFIPHTSVEEEMLVVNDLLDEMAAHHPQEAEITKLHYFAGFSVRECARALGLPPSSAHDRWRFARAWLVARMTDPEPSAK
jgi:RNA polymerase sigma factor (TIGR02999 family)